jgi:hypothetical protein|tara:strand:- start:102 stop:524 length:423 start_codon:yes stop_codon:yes gene_type:complete
MNMLLLIVVHMAAVVSIISLYVLLYIRSLSPEGQADIEIFAKNESEDVKATHKYLMSKQKQGILYCWIILGISLLYIYLFNGQESIIRTFSELVCTSAVLYSIAGICGIITLKNSLTYPQWKELAIYLATGSASAYYLVG